MKEAVAGECQQLLTRRKKTKTKAESQAKEAELIQQIGKLQMELEWL